MSKDLARKLKEARAHLKLSQSQAAKAWDIPLSTLQKWENDAATPRGFAFRALEAKLDEILRSDESAH